MIDIAETLLNEDAVLWERTDQQNDNGQWAFADPVEIKCHWEYKTGMMTDKAGTEFQFSSIVYVDRAIKEDSVLFEGSLADLTDPSSPRANNAVDVQHVGHVKSVDGEETLHVAYC